VPRRLVPLFASAPLKAPSRISAITLSSSQIICGRTTSANSSQWPCGFALALYLWGGKTSLGIDCSGLVQISLDAARIAAPRDTCLQEKAIGSPLAFDADLTGLRHGDVVFWRGHVGIMRDETMLLQTCNPKGKPWAESPLIQSQQAMLASPP